jgi:hypothetical protein
MQNVKSMKSPGTYIFGGALGHPLPPCGWHNVTGVPPLGLKMEKIHQVKCDDNDQSKGMMMSMKSAEKMKI